MQAALGILGYGPVCHGFNMLMHVQDVNMWEEGLKIKFFSSPEKVKKLAFGRKEFDNLLGDYEVASDFPPIVFAPELIAAYPEAKVILVERDIEAWYKSFEKTIIWNMFNPIVIFVVNLDYSLGRFSAQTRTMVRGYFGASTKEEFQARARPTYVKHYEIVRKVTPKDRLLDFQLTDGWEPLCRFLGKEVPNVPFPRINEAADFQRKSNINVKIAAKRVLKKGAKISGIIGVVILGILWYNSAWNLISR
jgi:hypothetical protein